MTAFRSPTDVGNRALQHLGSTLMDATLGFDDPTSRGATEMKFCYDKLREAELQRRLWTFATRRTVLRPVDQNTMLLAAALFAPDTTYFIGSIVSDFDGTLWISNAPNNKGNDPALTSVWEPYFGPLAVPLYDTSGTTAYFAGELVYTAAGDGTNRVYQSRQSNNSDVPATATAYSATVTYFKNQVVTFNAVAYMSLIDLNTGNEPDLAPALFNIATTYAAGAKVGGSDGAIYQSVGAGNVGHDPTSDNGVHWTNTGVLNPWTTQFVGGTGSDKWLQIGGKEFPSGASLTTLNIVYPLGSGPATQVTTRNVFRLPAGYLRMAPQSPKLGLNWLGGPSGSGYNDWLIENGFIITSDFGPITLRFITNITDVSRMDTMFCEGLAARVALEICDVVTQSSAKLGAIAKIYDRWITEAGQVNAIEDGFEDTPEDDLVMVRF